MISTHEETGKQVKGKIIQRNCKMSENCSGNVDKLKKTTALLVYKNQEKKKTVNFVVSGNHSLRGDCDGQNDL